MRSKQLILYIFLSFLLLVLSYFIFHMNQMDCAMPFGPCYHSWVQLPFLIILFTWSLVILYSVLLERNERRAKVIALISLGITFTGFLIYFIYHSLYKDHPTIFIWDNQESVRPYHIQLGSLFFFYFTIINFIALFQNKVKLWLRVVNFLITVLALVLINCQTKPANSFQPEEDAEASAILRLKIIENHVSPFYDMSKTDINIICSVTEVLKGDGIQINDTIHWSKQVYVTPRQLKTDTLEKLMQTDELRVGRAFTIFIKDREPGRTEYYDSIFQHLKPRQFDVAEVNASKIVFQKMKEYKLLKINE